MTRADSLSTSASPAEATAQDTEADAACEHRSRHGQPGAAPERDAQRQHDVEGGGSHDGRNVGLRYGDVRPAHVASDQDPDHRGGASSALGVAAGSRSRTIATNGAISCAIRSMSSDDA